MGFADELGLHMDTPPNPDQDSRVVIVGRLQQRSWTAEDGSARSTVEVVAEELGPSLRWATATTTRATRSQGQ
jgi:single-strand DNA-binding protein